MSKFFVSVLAMALLAAFTPAQAQSAAQLAQMGVSPGTDLSVEGNAAYLAANAKKPGVYRRPSGLQYKIVQSGFGRRPSAADSVSTYYTGTLINGTLFDGTSPGLPAMLKVGKVVPGFQEVLQLMREGDHWIVWIPSNIAYGAKGAAGGLVPPNQTLIFDLRLVSVTAAPRPGDKDYQPDPNDPDAVAAAQGAQ